MDDANSVLTDRPSRHAPRGVALNIDLSMENGEPDRIRTCDPLIKSQLLYLLSYGPTCAAERQQARSPRQGAAAGQAGMKLGERQTADRVGPIAGDDAGRGEHEGTAGIDRVRDGEAR